MSRPAGKRACPRPGSGKDPHYRQRASGKLGIAAGQELSHPPLRMPRIPGHPAYDSITDRKDTERKAIWMPSLLSLQQRPHNRDLLPSSCPPCSFPADDYSACHDGKQSVQPLYLLLLHGHSPWPSPETVPVGQAVRQDQRFFAITACFPCSDPDAPLPVDPDAPATSDNGPARHCSPPCSPGRASSGRPILRPPEFCPPETPLHFPAACPPRCRPGPACPPLPTSARRH